ncbi:MAG: Flp pilus assembly complex ATPase component TadA [Azoarcus sp.]|jgi:general secretion pathway protein E/type IV pilus assembly protein PilB|nr:Flp pilus assembly complex ATPase component TadA [Azoarcus sp.]
MNAQPAAAAAHPTSPPPAAGPSAPPIGQALLAAGLIGDDQLRIVLHEQRRRHRPFGRICVELGFIAETMLRDALSARLGRQAVDLAGAMVDPATLAFIPEALARRHTALPLAHDEEAATLTVAMADPQDLLALDALAAHCGPGIRLRPALAAESDIREALDRHYGRRLAIDDILQELETASPGKPGAAFHETGHPLMRLVDALLIDAVKSAASDIHFEPEAGFLRIRYRLDGILHQARALHIGHWPAMAVRLKVMAGLNIAETRAPQDGRVSLTVAGRPIDFRVSTLPTLHGENIVLRILDRRRDVVALDRIGFEPARLALVTRMLARPEGLILVTGPTGSGKTTTLYAMLGHLDDEAVNIMTLEDPVEYPMARIRQTAVGEAARIGFAAGVRTLLRQDPDIILIGEIRDAETAEMAIRAAMTGHRVFATLHANSAMGAIPRLLDLGIRPALLAGNLCGVIAQRLVRRLCPDCRRAAPASADERVLLGLPADGGEEISLAHPIGCPACAGRGYRGRQAILEVLPVDGALDELIAANAPLSELARAARASGYLELGDDGRRKALDGSTSLAELCRVVGPLAPAAPLPPAPR